MSESVKSKKWAWVQRVIPGNYLKSGTSKTDDKYEAEFTALQVAFDKQVQRMEQAAAGLKRVGLDPKELVATSNKLQTDRESATSDASYLLCLQALKPLEAAARKEADIAEARIFAAEADARKKAAQPAAPASTATGAAATPATGTAAKVSQSDFEQALAAQKALLDNAEARATAAVRGTCAAREAPAYSKAKDAMEAHAAKGDYAAALGALQERADQARTVVEASIYDSKLAGGMFTKWIPKADLAIAQSGPVLDADGKDLSDKAAIKAFEDLKRQRDQLLQSREYGKAAAMVDDKLGAAAQTAYAPYDVVMMLAKAEGLFKRAEAIRKKGIDEDDAAAWDDAKQKLQAAFQSGDVRQCRSLTWDKIDLAQSIVNAATSKAADKWAERGLKKSSSVKVEGLTTVPDLGKLSGDEKLDLLSGVQTSKKVDKTALVGRLKGAYGNMIAQGMKIDIPIEEIAAVQLYSEGGYGPMNATLRGKPPADAKVADAAKAGIALIKKALKRLPKYDAAGFPLFRWETPYGDYLKSRYQEGCEFTVQEFWSSGAGAGSYVGSDAPNTEILIWGKKKSGAKDISLLSSFGKADPKGTLKSAEGARPDGGKLKGQGGGEVLFPPGSKFKTLSFKAFDKDGTLVRKVDNQVSSGLTAEIFYRVEVQEL